MPDIRKHQAKDTATFHVRGADGELLFGEDAAGNPDRSKPMRITMYGPGSTVSVAARARQNKRLMAIMRDKKKGDQTPEQQRAMAADFLAEVTHSMENIEYEDLRGEALYKAVYGDQSIGFVAEQAHEFQGDWGNFSAGSSKPSNSTSAS